MDKKFQEFATNLGKGGSPGGGGKIPLGVKMIGLGAAAAYGVAQSVYTSKFFTTYCNNLT